MAGTQFTIENYSTLKNAIAQGAVRVKYGDKEVEYRSLDEMKEILGMMESELGIKKKKTFRRIAYFSKS